MALPSPMEAQSARGPVDQSSTIEFTIIELESTVDQPELEKDRFTTHVSRKVLNGFDWFKNLKHSDFAEANATELTLKGDTIKAWQAWLHLLDSDTDHRVAMPLKMEIVDIWEMFAIAHKYGINPKTDASCQWFEQWFYATYPEGTPSYEDCRKLLFPCVQFDCAEAFLIVTKELVYEANCHISETHPASFFNPGLHVPMRLIQQLNAARGRVRVILHQGLSNPISMVLEDGEDAENMKKLWSYMTVLYDTKVWPISPAGRGKSLRQILAGIDAFVTSQGPAFDSLWFAADMKYAARKAEEYFDGLCLDCMEHTKPGDATLNYWHRFVDEIDYDFDCRVAHDEPTWWFSCCGREREQILWKKERALKRKRSYSDYDEDQ